jgi:hypothetical protein
LREVRTDADGRYVVRGLASGAVPVSARAHGFVRRSAIVTLGAGETVRHELVLGRATRVVGVVRTAAGEPVTGATVKDGQGYLEFGEACTMSRADGSFVLTSVGSPIHLEAYHEVQGRAEVELRASADSEELRWNPVLVSGGRLAGVVLDERGEPLADWHVAAVEPQSLGLWLRESRTDAAGRFELLNCPEQHFVLAVRSPAEVFGDPVLVVDDFELGAEDLVLRVSDADSPSSFIVGAVAAADGAHLDQPQLYYASTSTNTGFMVTVDAERRFRIGPLRAGEYRLVASAEGLGEMATKPFVLAPDTTHDAGTLLLERAARLRVRFVFPEGREPESMQSQLTLDGSHADSIDGEGGSGMSRPLGPGNYVLSTRSWDWYAPEREVAVAAGETVEVELVLQPATHRSFEFVPPEGDRAERVLLVVSDEHGALVTSYESTHRNPAGRFGMGVGGLLPGVYSFEARASSGLSVAGSFTVLDLSGTDEPLVFPLR